MTWVVSFSILSRFGPRACQRERGRGDGVNATSRHRDAIDATARESTHRVSEL
jgi:hypothetical protein